MQINPNAAAYSPRSGRILRPGERAEIARFTRDRMAEHAAKERRGAGRYIHRLDLFGDWHDQAITPYAIDGIHPCATPVHRMFGPAEARADLRARARDCDRRARMFDHAVDFMPFPAAGALHEPQFDAALDARDYQDARARDHRATAQRIARHDLIGSPLA